MTPDVVVDIGNTRMKWGRCLIGREIRPVALSFDERDWHIVASEFGLTPPVRWVIASVNPNQLAHFTEWTTARGDSSLVLQRGHLRLPVNVEKPEQVGVDRLVLALAARSRLLPSQPGIVISIGTAMTVDLIDAEGVFQGGAILPGPQLMFRALHDHTAKLPLISAEDLGQPHPGYDERPPAKNTENAIVTGVVAAVAGAAQRLVHQLSSLGPSPPFVFVTGGAASYLTGVQYEAVAGVKSTEWLTLDGIRIAAEALP